MTKLSLTVLVVFALASGVAQAQNVAPDGGAVTNPANQEINAGGLCQARG